jgi:hypothetical protein
VELLSDETLRRDVRPRLVPHSNFLSLVFPTKATSPHYHNPTTTPYPHYDPNPSARSQRIQHKMPYLDTAQSWLTQSTLLLQARPATVRHLPLPLYYFPCASNTSYRRAYLQNTPSHTLHPPPKPANLVHQNPQKSPPSRHQHLTLTHPGQHSPSKPSTPSLVLL